MGESTTTYTFDKLIAPFSREQFFSEYWEKKHLLLRREDTAYYRAPLPAGMLGKHTGDRAVIQLPSGTVEVEILGISPAPIE